MIQRVVFHQFVTLDHNQRGTWFDGVDGWQIAEVEPGRVRLERGAVRVTVQDVPYELVESLAQVREATEAIAPPNDGLRQQHIELAKKKGKR